MQNRYRYLDMTNMQAKINRLPGTLRLCRKSGLAELHSSFLRRFPELPPFVPETWSLPSQQEAARARLGAADTQLWIVKPCGQSGEGSAGVQEPGAVCRGARGAPGHLQPGAPLQRGRGGGGHRGAADLHLPPPHTQGAQVRPAAVRAGHQVSRANIF